MLFSNELEPFHGPLPESIVQCLEEIRQFFGVERVQVLMYSETQIAVPVTYAVSLPTRGAVGDIDIREEEPVLIVISSLYYPAVMPKILSDRKDFPKQYLPHLYVSAADKPASFCLVRNSPSEWFANKRMTDLLTVTSQWLYKAGNGLLAEDNNEFDPTRLDNAFGYHIYRYSFLHDIVTGGKSFLPYADYAVLTTSIEKGEGNTRYKSTLSFDAQHIGSVVDILRKHDKDLEKVDLKFLFSLLVWKPGLVEAEYDTEFPKTYGALKVYFGKRAIAIDAILHTYLSSGYQLRNGIPLIHAIQRPKKVAGYNGHYEFINFMIMGDEAENAVIPDHARVWVQLHNEPFSSEVARTLSGENRNVSTLFIGAGSLGSKMILHDARAGKLHIGVIDHDDLLEHNLARHVLYEKHIGENKAKATIQEVSAFYKVDAIDGFKAYANNIVFLPNETFANYQWLVDTSASKQVHHELVARQLSGDLNIARCELVHDGKLGLLYIEGKNRNPRLDDLMNLTCYLAVQNRHLEAWRRSDEKRELKTLDIGLGCSSSTTVMSDDTISFHACLFSKMLYQQQERKGFGNKGFLFRSIYESNEDIHIGTESNIIEPFEIYYCQRDSGWQIRFMKGMSADFFRLCKKRGTVETGGALIGVANYKTKTIHVFEIVVEPRGSKGTCSGFIRGTGGLPEQVNLVKEKTGQVIGYVGEWHTHPMNLERLSDRDEETVRDLQRLNRKVPIPTLALIVTRQKVLPFVFE